MKSIVSVCFHLLSSFPLIFILLYFLLSFLVALAKKHYNVALFNFAISGSRSIYSSLLR
jgi:hypothetical protein